MPQSGCDDRARCTCAADRTADWNGTARSYNSQRPCDAVHLRWLGWRQSNSCMVRVADRRRPIVRNDRHEHGCEVGSLLAGACLRMRDWDHKDEQPSIALWIEAVMLLIAWVLALSVAVASLFGAAEGEAHPGRLAAEGYHKDRKNAGRHCHRGPSAGTSTNPSGNGKVYYTNCAAVRAAGAAPIYRGQQGYGTHLDRDGDGKVCE